MVSESFIEGTFEKTKYGNFNEIDMVSDKRNDDCKIFIEKLKNQAQENSGIPNNLILAHVRNPKILILLETL